MTFSVSKVSDGAQIAYARFGQTDKSQGGTPAFYFHGLPGSAAEGELFHQACIKHNVELIAVDRFGYGQSSNVKENRFNRWAQAIKNLADELKFDRFYIFAVSGGGPYALACASLLQERVTATGIACGLGPVIDESLRNQMRPMATSAFYLAQQHPFLLTVSYGVAVKIAARYFSHKTIDILGKINLPVDRAALNQTEAYDIMQRNLSRAFLHGIKGAKSDLITAQQPWPFELGNIKNLQLWHGDSDRVVPISHSQWVQQQVPDAVLYVMPGQGHFSLPINYADEIIGSVIN